MNDTYSILNTIEKSMAIRSVKINFLNDGSIFRLDKNCLNFLNIQESGYLVNVLRLAFFKKFNYDFVITDGFYLNYFIEIRIDYNIMEVLKFLKELLEEDFNGRVEYK